MLAGAKGEAEGKDPMLISTKGCHVLGENPEIFTDKTSGAFFQWVFALYGDQEELIKDLTRTAGGEPVEPQIQPVTQPAQPRPTGGGRPPRQGNRSESQTAAQAAVQAESAAAAESGDEFIPNFTRLTKEEQRIIWKLFLGWMDLRFRAMESTTYEKNVGRIGGLASYKNEVLSNERPLSLGVIRRLPGVVLGR